MSGYAHVRNGSKLGKAHSEHMTSAAVNDVSKNGASASRNFCSNARPGHARAYRTCLPSRGRPEDDRGGRNDHAGCSTKVSCGASSLPRVSRLNSSAGTNATATSTVAISIGIAKPCGKLAASTSPLIDHCFIWGSRARRNLAAPR